MLDEDLRIEKTSNVPQLRENGHNISTDLWEIFRN